MEITRRQFIKRASLTASLIIGWPRLARSWGIGSFFSSSQDGGVSTNWPTWDESTQGGLADENVFVNRMEELGVSNETGEGLDLAGANLVFTQNGAIPGGDGTKRTFGNNDYMTGTATFASSFLNETAWSLIIKVNPTLEAGLRFAMEFSDAGVNNTAQIYTNADNTMTFRIREGGGGYEDKATTDTISNAVNYLAFWTDGTTLRGGFTTTRPTKLTDFNGANAETVTFAYTGDFSGVTWTRIQALANDAVNQNLEGDYYYFVGAKVNLIDNDN